MATETKASFCPRCGSPSIESSAIAGTASCTVCKWTGKETELAFTMIQHGLGSDEKVLAAFVRDIRNVFARNAATQMGLALMKWGFIPSKDAAVQAKYLTRYLEAIAKAICAAVVEERQKIEKEGAKYVS